MGEQRTISGLQFTLMLVVSYLTAGIFTFPRDIVGESGAGGLFSFFFTTGIAVGGALLIAWVGSYFPGMTAVEWGDAIIPFRIHRVLASLGGLFHTLMTPIVIRTFAELLKETFFQVTPSWVLCASLLLVAGYGAYLGVEAVARVTVVTLPLMLLTISLAYVLAAPLFELYRLRLVFPPLPDLLRGAFYAGLLYEGFASMMILQSKLEKPRRALVYVLWSFGISTILFLLIYVATVLSFGIHGVKVIAWPAPQLLLLVRITGWFTERLGLFVEMAWAGLLILSAAVHIWAVSLVSVQVLGLKQRKAHNWVLAAVVLIFFVQSVWPRDVEAVQLVFRMLPWGGIYLNLLLPLLWLIVGLARGKFRRPHPQGHRAQ